jgi:hypothetical protein
VPGASPCRNDRSTGPIDKNGGEAIVDHPRCIALIKDRKPHTVKPGETVKCAKPQIAIGRLSDARHGVLRQPIGGGPDIETVLLGISALTRAQQDEQCARQYQSGS